MGPPWPVFLDSVEGFLPKQLHKSMHTSFQKGVGHAFSNAVAHVISCGKTLL